ncbi:MAG: 50S ribosomal protein L3 N(5)-glutamine methyltransferase [Burkholderiales bacterium]|nr:50S ribosomal protein L3 N(5)-glutamine methyltransferase [Burkholderiales bacterium]
MRSTERRPRAAPALRTLRDALHHGVRRFRQARLAFGHGTTNAFDEAAYLTLHALRLPLHELEPHLDLRLTARQLDRILKLFERRIAERKPAAYLTREAWLGDFRFYVDERVIVPRSYIAELLRDDLAPWIARPAKIKAALDLCTGSGCLAILLAHSFPRARIDAVDIDRNALRVARRNVDDYSLADRIALHQADLFSALPGKRYDLILSNPPYVTAASMRRLPPEYRSEPGIALAGGSDGLAVVRTMLSQAAAHLNPGGMLVVEVGHNRRGVEKAYPRLPFTWPETSGGDDCVFLLSREQLLP